MGNCNKHEIEPEVEYESNRVELLKSIKNNLNAFEENIQKVKKEDIHYKMKKFIFWLNLLQQINPYIKILEDDTKNKNLNLEKIKKSFDEIFQNLWSNERNKFYANLDCLKESFFKTDSDKIDDQIERERLSKLNLNSASINVDQTPTPK